MLDLFSSDDLVVSTVSTRWPEKQEMDHSQILQSHGVREPWSMSFSFSLRICAIGVFSKNVFHRYRYKFELRYYPQTIVEVVLLFPG